MHDGKNSIRDGRDLVHGWCHPWPQRSQHCTTLRMKTFPVRKREVYVDRRRNGTLPGYLECKVRRNANCQDIEMTHLFENVLRGHLGTGISTKETEGRYLYDRAILDCDRRGMSRTTDKILLTYRFRNTCANTCTKVFRSKTFGYSLLKDFYVLLKCRWHFCKLNLT